MVCALLLYGAGSLAYVQAYKVDRPPGTAVVAAAAGLVGEAARLAEAFAASHPGRRVIVLDALARERFRVEPRDAAGGTGLPEATLVHETDPPPAEPPGGEAEALARLLEEGAADFVLAEGETLAKLARQASVERQPVFRHATLLAVPFPATCPSISAGDARMLADGLEAGRRVAWPQAGLRVMDPADRTPEWQVLEVDGVYPTLATVSSGAYPLTSEARLVSRRAGGLLALVGRLPFVRAWSLASRPAVRDLASWLGTPAAQAAFWGTPLEVTLTAVGDVMLGRKVARDIEANGLGWPFGLVSGRLGAADLTFCNLEAPLSTAGTPLPGKEIWLRGKPEYAACLKEAGIDVVSLANNHILDYDTPALLETLSVLDQNGIKHCGGGRNITEARAPAVLEAGGLRVAFLAYTEFADIGLFWSWDYERSFEATDKDAGCAPLRLAVVGEDIARARALADVVVVAYHWGLEDINYPKAFNPANDLEAIARQTVDLGASLVLGTHPHAIQGLEVYHGGLIAYSLGNFVMDQRRDTQKESMILDVVLGPSGVVTARVTPVWIDTTRPRVLEGREGARLLAKINEISVGFRSHQ